VIVATVLERAPVVPERAESRLGVSILTYNRADEVSRTVERMVSLPERPRIVVVDNGSTDGTVEILGRRFPEVRCVALEENLGAAGRNAGVAVLDTPYVALCDDDTWWEPGSLARAAALFDAYPRLALLAGAVLVGPENRLDPISREMAASPIQVESPLPGPAVVGFLACAAMVRRSAFLQVGGFERRFFIGGEEELLALDLLSAGWELAYVEDIVVHHHPSETARDTSGRRRIMVRNRLWVGWMRLPLTVALARTFSVLRGARGDSAQRAGLVEALAGLPWALRRRRVVPPRVQRRLTQVLRR
jgi:N-acetylglucosaminyl-diphospho-decaprenol L-rhamnosyltransferase